MSTMFGYRRSTFCGGGCYWIALFLCIPQMLVQGTSNTTIIGYTGTTTTITCPVEANFTFPDWRGPPDDLPYYQGGLNIFNPALGEKLNRLSIAMDNRSLEISKTTLNDTGVYSCVKANGSLYIGKTTLLTRTRAMQPEITSTTEIDDNGVRGTEGLALTVTCKSEGGYPAPSVAWYRGNITGQPLNQTNTGTQVGDTYIVRLDYTFIPSRRDDRQELVCRSYWPTPADEQGLQLTNIIVYLSLKPLQPSIVQTASVVAGDDVILECRANGSRPAANISWTYQGQTYIPALTATQDQTTKTFTTVSVFRRPVTAADNGQTVMCRVSHVVLDNDLNESSTLDVQFPVERLSTRITGNKAIVATDFSNLTLVCTTGSSNPASAISWKNGSDVIVNNNSYNHTAGTNNGVVRSQELTLTPTRYMHGNNISCAVSNGVNQFTDIVSDVLDVHYHPLLDDIADRNATEGDTITFKCSVSSNPLANITWKRGSDIIAQGTGTASYSGLDHTLSKVARGQADIYTCTADNRIPPSDSKSLTLTVFYPPDVTVTSFVTTVNNQSTTVTCNASGLPDQYTYERWVHTWNGKVVTHPEPLPAERVLTLNGLSYAHSGVYTCGASNGIKGVMHGAGSLLVKSFPVIVGKDATSKEIHVWGQLLRPIVVSVQYYSNAGRGSVSIYKWTNGTEVGEVHYKVADVTLQVFTSEITTAGTEAFINLTVIEESLFGEYDIVVKNEIGHVNISLVIQPAGPPEPPHDLKLLVANHESAFITWLPGLPKGLNQTFIVQLSTDNITWQNYSQYGGMSYQRTQTIRLENLADSQLYFVRMLALNIIGESQTTKVYSFKTEGQPKADLQLGQPKAVFSPSVFVGGAAVGALIAALVGGIGFIFWKRRVLVFREHDSPADKKTYTSSKERQYEDIGQTPDSYSGVQPQNTDVEEQNHENNTPTVYESLQTSEAENVRTYEQLQNIPKAEYENMNMMTHV